MIEITNLTFYYEERKKLFENFSASFQKGERVWLKGGSGRGKTTLLRLISELEKPISGKIMFQENAKISFCFQGDDLFSWYTAKKNVSLVSDDKTAERFLKEFGLADSLDKKPDELSGGMKKRVSLARAAAYRPDILLIDEGFNGLEKELRKKIMDFIRDELKNALIIFASHDEEDGLYFANRVIEL